MGIFAKMPTKCHFNRLNFESIFGCKHTRTPPKQKLPWCDLRAPSPLTHLQENQTQTYKRNSSSVWWKNIVINIWPKFVGTSVAKCFQCWWHGARAVAGFRTNAADRTACGSLTLVAAGNPPPHIQPLVGWQWCSEWMPTEATHFFPMIHFPKLWEAAYTKKLNCQIALKVWCKHQEKVSKKQEWPTKREQGNLSLLSRGIRVSQRIQRAKGKAQNLAKNRNWTTWPSIFSCEPVVVGKAFCLHFHDAWGFDKSHLRKTLELPHVFENFRVIYFEFLPTSWAPKNPLFL